MCRYIVKNGRECHFKASIDGLCIKHYIKENDLKDTCKDIRKIDITIKLYKE